MEKSKVIPATQEMVDYLKGRLREEDKREVYAMSGRDADEALQEGFKASELCWVGLWEDEPVACFGARRLSILSDRGVPWLLGTDKIKEVRRPFVEKSIQYTKVMAQQFEYLENWVDARNEISIRWLMWCGFTVDVAPIPFGVFKLPFHRFWLRSKDHV